MVGRANNTQDYLHRGGAFSRQDENWFPSLSLWNKIWLALTELSSRAVVMD